MTQPTPSPGSWSSGSFWSWLMHALLQALSRGLRAPGLVTLGLCLLQPPERMKRQRGSSDQLAWAPWGSSRAREFTAVP